MINNDIKKEYKTNVFASAMFYAALIVPILFGYLAYLTIHTRKDDWILSLMILFCGIFIEFLYIYYLKTKIIITEDEIILEQWKTIQRAKWSDIIELNEHLFNWGGNLIYVVKTKNGKKIRFTDSIKNFDNLLKEIESRTNLKFKKRF